jgi:hypothetical protein
MMLSPLAKSSDRILGAFATSGLAGVDGRAQLGAAAATILNHE